jgi:hypothetical protein
MISENRRAATVFPLRSKASNVVPGFKADAQANIAVVGLKYSAKDAFSGDQSQLNKASSLPPKSNPIVP